MTLPKVSINEVSPRDGFQNEAVWIETGRKVEFVNALSRAGFAKIEVSSFVSPNAIPQLRDAGDLFRRILRSPGITYVALVPNVRGVADALTAAADEVNFVASVSEAHNQANMRMTCARSIALLKEIGRELSSMSVRLHATAATAFACPFEGEQPVEKTIVQVARYIEAGARSITLADTIGTANPWQVARLVEAFLREFGSVPLTLHFHDTRGMALANVLRALDLGVRSFDGAAGGIGGCPFAPGATGNVCTEEMVHMLVATDFDTGIDFERLMHAASLLPDLIGHEVPSRILRAGPSWAAGRNLDAGSRAVQSRG